MDNWLRNAWKFQQERYEELGDRQWDRLNSNTELLLNKVKIAFEVCYGENYSSNEALEKCTDKVKTELLKLFVDKRYGRCFSCCFLNLRLKNEAGTESLFCLFFLQDYDGKERCVDLMGRNYKSWNEFLTNNKLPECFIVYPKCGNYYRQHADNFVDVSCEESDACSVGSTLKRVVDIASTIGSIGAAGVLVFNPVTAPVLLGAMGVSIVTGVYTVGNGINRLVDIHEHEGGLDLENAETALTLAEIALTTVGTAAVGASAGIKGLAAKTGKTLTEGTIACKLANNVGKISRVYCGINAGLNATIIIVNYRNGRLSDADILRLHKAIFFSLFAIVPVNVLGMFIEHISNFLSIEQVKYFICQSPVQCINAIHSTVRALKEFSVNDSPDTIMQILFPDLYTLHRAICSTGVLLGRVTNIVKIIENKNFLELLKDAYIEGQFDPSFCDDVKKELHGLVRDIKNYKRTHVSHIINAQIINQWTRDNGIYLSKNKSTIGLINHPAEIEQQIKATIKVCFGREIASYEKKLFNELFSFVNCHKLKAGLYFINKIKFYCNNFQHLYESRMEEHQINFFLSTYKGSSKSKTDYFQSKGYLDIYESVFKESLCKFGKDISKYHQEFEVFFSSSQNQYEKQVIYDFKMSLADSKSRKEKFYEKAKELRPSLKTRLNENDTTFHEFHDFAILKCVQNKFTLLFYCCDIQDDGFMSVYLICV